MDMVHEREVSSEKEVAGDLRRGPWTVEEDLLLGNYIAMHGEGRWNSLARAAGLKRTGKSCRLRWLNYLRPDLRRGNITPQEQLLILELHSRWGNRWSKIAQHLPGRTDNEIKNYWRTRVQKHAKQLKCDVNSQQFKDVMRFLWMPRLIERIHAASLPATAVAACGGVVEPPSTLPDWPADVLVNPGPEVSSTTTAGSSSCTSTDSAAGMKFRSPPVAERAHGHDTSGAATCDTLRHHGLTQQQPQPGPFGQTESWHESLSGLEVGSGFGFPDIGLSDFEIYTLCDNTWGAVDDLWYMQGL